MVWLWQCFECLLVQWSLSYSFCCSLIVFLSPSFSVGSSFIVYFFNTYFREESEACGEQICDRELHQEVVHSRELKRFIIIMFSFLKGYHLQSSYSLLVKRFIIYNYLIPSFLKGLSFTIIFLFTLKRFIIYKHMIVSFLKTLSFTIISLFTLKRFIINNYLILILLYYLLQSLLYLRANFSS